MYMYISIYYVCIVYIYICVYEYRYMKSSCIYIYIQREEERERETEIHSSPPAPRRGCHQAARGVCSQTVNQLPFLVLSLAYQSVFSLTVILSSNC